MTEVNFLVVDLFCGAGGVTIGFDQAIGWKVIAAVNHDPKAIESHWKNHPDVHHFEEDIRTLDLTELIDIVKFQRSIHPNAKLVLWASLECTNFSKAKGGQPRDADSRTLADHLHRYIEAIHPNAVMIENVVEFMSWGPLDKNGKPVSKDQGRDWLRWRKSINAHGYRDEWKQMNAADFGARTSRNRLFGVFADAEFPITWPEQTHAKNPGKASLFSSLKKWEPCRPCLDLDDHGTSIFTPGKIKSAKTFERILAGLIKYVAGMGQKEFMMKYNSMASDGNMWHSVNSVDAPAPTVAAQRQPNLVTMIHAHYSNETGLRSVDEAAPTIPCADVLGKVDVQFLDRQFSSGQIHQSVEDPHGALLTNPKSNLVTPILIDTNFNNNGRSIDEPAPTITANRKWHYIMNPQYFNRGASIDGPHPTLIARMDKMPPYLVLAESGEVCIEVYETDMEVVKKIKHFMAMYGIMDIKMRMLKVSELKRIQGFPEDYHLMGNQSDQKKFIGNSVVPDVVRHWANAITIKLTEREAVAA